MPEAKYRLDSMNQMFTRFGPSQHEIAAQKKIADERKRADAEMAVRFANLTMPEDIRSRARSWRMEAFFDVLWNSAFQAGYREAMRDRAASPDDK